MIKVSNVLKRDHPLTRQEETINNTLFAALIFAIVLVIFIMYTLITERLQELISVLRDISVFLIVILSLMVHQFLYGCRYIRRHNKAIQNGERFQGTVVEKYVTSWGARQGTQYRFAVQLDNGQTVKTPVYTTIDIPFKECDVYYYRRKYYFTEFQWLTNGRDLRRTFPYIE